MRFLERTARWCASWPEQVERVVDADPTPSDTGSVATFTPMPRITIRASQSTDVIASGMMVTTVARQLRKVIKHKAATAA